MSLAYGPRKFDIAVQNASEVTVQSWPSLASATLSTPVSIGPDGSVSFAVASSGQYLVTIRSQGMIFSERVALTSTTYDITDHRSYADRGPNVGTGNATIGSGGSSSTANADPAWALLRSALSTRNQGARPIVYTGSSTTAGFNASDQAHRYTDLLTASLQAAYPLASGSSPAMWTLASAVAAAPLPTGVQGVNASVSGSTAANYLTSTSVTQIASLNPSAIIHMIGSNDYRTGITPGTYKATVESWLTALRSALTKPTLHVLVGTYKRNDAFTPAYDWSLYATALREIADVASDVVFVDLQPAYDALGVPAPDSLNLLDTDEVHQTDAGHATMADLLQNAMQIPLGTSSSTATSGVVLLDTFSRANSATVGAAETGQVWTPAVGTWSIASGKLAITTTGTIIIPSGLSNLSVQSDITYNAGISGVLLRVQDDNTRLGAYLDSSLGVAIYKRVAGANTPIANTAQAWTNGQVYNLRVTAVGAVINVYVDYVLRLTYTLTAPELAAFAPYTQVGARVSGAGATTFDNFIVKSL